MHIRLNAICQARVELRVFVFDAAFSKDEWTCTKNGISLHYSPTEHIPVLLSFQKIIISFCCLQYNIKINLIN